MYELLSCFHSFAPGLTVCQKKFDNLTSPPSSVESLNVSLEKSNGTAPIATPLLKNSRVVALPRTDATGSKTANLSKTAGAIALKSTPDFGGNSSGRSGSSPVVKIEQDGSPNQESEMERLKKELEAAKGKIAEMDEQLAQQRISHSLNSILQSPSEEHFDLSGPSKAMFHHSSYLCNEDMSDRSSHLSPHSTDASQGPWDDARPGPLPYLNAPFTQAPNKLGWNSNISASVWAIPDSRTHGVAPSGTFPLGPQPQRPANLRLDGFGYGSNYNVSNVNAGYDSTYRRVNIGPSRPGSGLSLHNGFNSYPASSIASTPLRCSPPMTPAMNTVAPSQPSMSYGHHHPIGTPLSPTASEFARPPSSMASYPMTHWHNQVLNGHKI